MGPIHDVNSTAVLVSREHYIVGLLGGGSQFV